MGTVSTWRAIKGKEGWLGSLSVNLYSLEKMSRDCAGRKKRKQESPLSLPPIANNHPPPASRYHHHPTSSLLPSSLAHTHTHTRAQAPGRDSDTGTGAKCRHGNAGDAAPHSLPRPGIPAPWTRTPPHHEQQRQAAMFPLGRPLRCHWRQGRAVPTPLPIIST